VLAVPEQATQVPVLSVASKLGTKTCPFLQVKALLASVPSTQVLILVVSAQAVQTFNEFKKYPGEQVFGLNEPVQVLTPSEQALHNYGPVVSPTTKYPEAQVMVPVLTAVLKFLALKVSAVHEVYPVVGSDPA